MRRQLLALFVLSVGLSFPRLGLAQYRAGEDSDSGKAAARFQQAVDLYREGSYEGALAEFRRAYQISPSYRVLYNIAQTQYALHDFVGAYKSLAQYLAEGRREISAERLSQVDEMSARLRERIAHLQISVNVASAEVRLDDVAVGSTPLQGPIPVNVGTHKVTATKSGWSAAIRIVALAGKENAKVDLQMEETGNGSTPLSGGATRMSESSTVATKLPSPAGPNRTGLLVSLSATAALAVATGVCGYLALRAQQDLKDQVAAYPNTRDNVENARMRSKNYAYLTDALGTATLVSGGVALYFVLSHQWDTRKDKPGKTQDSVAIAPTPTGVVVHGTF